MGLITSIFRRKKDIIEILESLDNEISSLENRKRQNLDLQKRVIGSLILYSIVFYITGAIIFFVYYFPTSWKHRFIYSLPLFAFPFLIFGVKRLLHWYFVQRISHNDRKLRILREKKKKMLEDVMEKETYKKAMKILERFDPLRFNRMDIEGPRSSSASRQTTPEPRQGPAREPGSELRFRGPLPQATPGGGPPNTTPAPPTATPALDGTRCAPLTKFGPAPTPMRPGMGRGRTPPPMGRPVGVPPQLARPILPRERTAMDRVIDLLVGDGPERRYALICGNCSSHNGMALQEEFEYLHFRCCYCGFMNPARKMRPRAPAQLFSAPSQSSSVEPSCGEERDEEEEEEEDDSPLPTADEAEAKERKPHFSSPAQPKDEVAAESTNADIKKAQ